MNNSQKPAPLFPKTFYAALALLTNYQKLALAEGNQLAPYYQAALKLLPKAKVVCYPSRYASASVPPCYSPVIHSILLTAASATTKEEAAAFDALVAIADTFNTLYQADLAAYNQALELLPYDAASWCLLELHCKPAPTDLPKSCKSVIFETLVAEVDAIKQALDLELVPRTDAIVWQQIREWQNYGYFLNLAQLAHQCGMTARVLESVSSPEPRE